MHAPCLVVRGTRDAITSHMDSTSTPFDRPLDNLVIAGLGAVALYFGTRRRGLLGWALAAAGGKLISRGLGGRPAPTRGPADFDDSVGLRRAPLNQAAAERLRI